jgi:hypothetical protein
LFAICIVVSTLNAFIVSEPESLGRQKAAVAPVSGEFLPSIKEWPATGRNGGPKINMSSHIQQPAKRASRALTSVRRFRTPPLRDLAEAGKRKQGSPMGAPKGRPGSGWDREKQGRSAREVQKDTPCKTMSWELARSSTHRNLRNRDAYWVGSSSVLVRDAKADPMTYARSFRAGITDRDRSGL